MARSGQLWWAGEARLNQYRDLSSLILNDHNATLLGVTAFKNNDRGVNRPDPSLWEGRFDQIRSRNHEHLKIAADAAIWQTHNDLKRLRCL